MNKQHLFETHNYLKDIGYPDFEENWNEQLKSMEPDLFMKMAHENYEGKHIV